MLRLTLGDEVMPIPKPEIELFSCSELEEILPESEVEFSPTDDKSEGVDCSELVHPSILDCDRGGRSLESVFSLFDSGMMAVW